MSAPTENSVNKKWLSAALAVLMLAPLAHAQWPAKVFAPYAYLEATHPFQIMSCFEATGQKYYTLAFIIAGKDGNPAWDGQTAINSPDGAYYAPQINDIRTHGGDVLISFGGEGGQELALVEADPNRLVAKYQLVVSQYQMTWLDFDIEGKGLEDKSINHRRNAALAQLQKNNPGLIISFTLPGDPNGLSDESKDLLSDAKAKGLKVKSVNVMTMDFGPRFSAGKADSAVSIATSNKTHEQVSAIDAAIQIGLTPMIGVNDVKTEIFSQTDAQTLLDYANAHDWVCSMSFWSSNRDTGTLGGKSGTHPSAGVPQQPWDFTNILKHFTR